MTSHRRGLGSGLRQSRPPGQVAGHHPQIRYLVERLIPVNGASREPASASMTGANGAASFVPSWKPGILNARPVGPTCGGGSRSSGQIGLTSAERACSQLYAAFVSGATLRNRTGSRCGLQRPWLAGWPARRVQALSRVLGDGCRAGAQRFPPDAPACPGTASSVGSPPRCRPSYGASSTGHPAEPRRSRAADNRQATCGRHQDLSSDGHEVDVNGHHRK